MKHRKSTVGKHIEKALIDRDMNQVQLAQAVGTTPQYLNYILHGRRSGEMYLKRIANILKLDVKELENMKTNEQ